MIYNRIFYSKSFYYSIFGALFAILLIVFGFFIYNQSDIKNRNNISVILYEGLKSSDDAKLKEVINSKTEPYYSIALLKSIQNTKNAEDLIGIKNNLELASGSAVESIADFAKLKLDVLEKSFDSGNKIYYFSSMFLNVVQLINSTEEERAKELLSNITSATDANQYIRELAKEVNASLSAGRR